MKNPMAQLELVDATADQILNLNNSQMRGAFHPFTCPNRGDGEHRHLFGDLGALVATRRGWICPWCDYTQSWAHGFMATAVADDPFVASMMRVIGDKLQNTKKE